MSDLEEYYEKQKREYKPNKIFSGTKGIFAVAVICFFGCWVLLFVGLVFSNPYRFSLPYNAIDFQKIAYIDNQFVVYGIDYDKPKPYSLVIFNSIDGRSWDKSEIAFTKDQNVNVSYQASFNYFKGQCYLFGATLTPLVASDCRHWHNQAIEIESATNAPNGLAWGVPGSVVVKDRIYISTNKNGVYSSSDGVKWENESLPNPTGNKYPLEFGSIASGNNKIIAEASMPQDKKLIGVIYTKDLQTNKWSYEVYPVAISNITRGKDRFVAMSESTALVLVDGEAEWQSAALQQRTYSMTFGLNDKFVGTNPIHISSNGIQWTTIKFTEDELGYSLYIACNSKLCISVGDKYQIIGSKDGVIWKHYDFGYKNPKPHWWRRFF